MDRVTVKGSASPIKLYTIDIPGDLDDAARASISAINIDLRQDDYLYLNSLMASRQLFRTDADLVYLQKVQDKQFRKVYDQAVADYLGGKWGEAKTGFCEALLLNPSDGPTHTNIRFLKKYSYEAPENWQGYRKLTDK